MRLSRITLAATAAVAFASAASAALAPNYQRIAELGAILGHPAIAGAFGGRPIDRIEYVGPDLYRVWAGRCRLDVTIVDTPSAAPVPGGRRFQVQPGKESCP